MPDKLLKALLIIGAIIAWIFIIVGIAQHWTKKPAEANLDRNYAIIQGDSLKAYSIPVYIPPIIYGSLINCLEMKESSGNPNAVGKAGEKGCLQFLPQTWKENCEGDIWDCENQRRCADKLIERGYLRYRTTAKLCIS